MQYRRPIWTHSHSADAAEIEAIAAMQNLGEHAATHKFQLTELLPMRFESWKPCRAKLPAI